MKSEARNLKSEMSRAGWICAAVVLLLFGLQQIFPLREMLMLSGGASQKTTLLAWRALTCMFVHGNWPHAVVNALAFICLFYGVQRTRWIAPLLTGLLAGWVAVFQFALCLMPQNAWLVGSSGIIFGVLGHFTAVEPYSRWKFCFIGSIPLVVLAPLLVALDAGLGMAQNHIAWQVHSTAFAGGVALGTISAVAKVIREKD